MSLSFDQSSIAFTTAERTTNALNVEVSGLASTFGVNIAIISAGTGYLDENIGITHVSRSHSIPFQVGVPPKHGRVTAVAYYLGFPIASATLELFNAINLPPVGIDLDIDSDNNQGTGLPAGSNWEERLEDEPYAVGKLIMLDNETRADTPIVIRLPPNMNATDPNIGVTLDWLPGGPAGTIKIWLTQTATRSSLPITEGGHRVEQSISYRLDELQYDPGSGEIVLYVEGYAENTNLKTLAGVERTGRPNQFISATLSSYGRLASDFVKYLVANEDSFFYDLVTRPEVQTALAARAVYNQNDLKSFGMRVLSKKDDLAEFEIGVGKTIPGVVRPLLLSEDEHHIAGFNAALYESFLGVAPKYVLAFAGTDDNVWEREYHDWINNVSQGLGLYAEQYYNAMLLAWHLSNANLFAGDALVVAGHSLGGGLASAAAVVGGYHGYSFNAAGLSRSTVEDFLVTNPSPGALFRFDNPNALVDAYWVDWDILSNLQDSTPIANALGTRHKLDGPFDGSFAFDAALVLGGAALEQPWLVVAAKIHGYVNMVMAHLYPSVLFGLLYEGPPAAELRDRLGYEYFF